MRFSTLLCRALTLLSIALLSSLALQAAETPPGPEREIHDRLAKAHQLYLKHKFKQAADEIEKANQIAGGKCGSCLLALVGAEFADGQRDRAVETARAAVALGGPERFAGAAYNALGSLLIDPRADEARLAEAEVDLRRAVELGNGMARINLASLELRRQHSDQALTLARQYLADEPAGTGTGSAHILICHARAALGQLSPATGAPPEGGEPESNSPAALPAKNLYREPVRVAKGSQGVAVVDLTLDTEGCVVASRVADAGKNPKLVEPLLEAVRYWVFQPASLQGKPVRFNYHLVYNFNVPYDWNTNPPSNPLDPFNNPYTYNLNAADYAGKRH